MRIISSIFILLIILLGITFATLNSQLVTINYYVGHRDMPLSMLLVIAFVTGCLLGLIVAGWIAFRTKMQNRKLRKRLKLAEKEVENLRAIPLKDKH